MLKLLRQAFVSFGLLTVLTGVVYPLAVTGVAKGLFGNEAEGSLVDKEGRGTSDVSRAVGSRLIGQAFDAPGYFWPRPSATTATGGMDGLPYNAAQSSGSNLGPTNPALLDAVKGRVEALQKADPANTEPVPVDLVTASGSGLDPEESVAAARYQARRVAAARGVAVEKVMALIDEHTEEAMLGVLGERVVNVLELNLALDRAFPMGAATQGH